MEDQKHAKSVPRLQETPLNTAKSGAKLAFVSFFFGIKAFFLRELKRFPAIFQFQNLQELHFTADVLNIGVVQQLPASCL